MSKMMIIDISKEIQDIKIDDDIILKIPIQVDIDKVIDDLSEIYIEMCGVSIAYRTICWDIMCKTLEYKNISNYNEQIDYLNEILDKKWIEYKKYDVSYVENYLLEMYELIMMVPQKYHNSLYFGVFVIVKFGF